MRFDYTPSLQGKTLTALALVVSDPRSSVRDPEETKLIVEEDGILKSPPPAGGTLILGPKSTLRSTWQAKIQRRLVGMILLIKQSKP